MIGNFIDDGKEYPCVGISFGLSSIYEILKNDNNINASKTEIYIIPMDTEIESLKIANILRTIGYNVEIELNNRKLKKSLDFANKQGIRYVIIIGTNELQSNKLNVKDMKNGTNVEIRINELNMLDLTN